MTTMFELVDQIERLTAERDDAREQVRAMAEVVAALQERNEVNMDTAQSCVDFLMTLVRAAVDDREAALKLVPA